MTSFAVSPATAPYPLHTGAFCLLGAPYAALAN
jgi:hypothetical protein